MKRKWILGLLLATPDGAGEVGCPDVARMVSYRQPLAVWVKGGAKKTTEQDNEINQERE